jgi:hypothetical protein
MVVPPGGKKNGEKRKGREEKVNEMGTAPTKLIQSSCKVHAKFMQNSCKVHAKFMQSSCKVHAKLFFFCAFSWFVSLLRMVTKLRPQREEVVTNWKGKGQKRRPPPKKQERKRKRL